MTACLCHCGLGSRNARGAQLSSAASPMPGLRYARTEAWPLRPGPQSRKSWMPPDQVRGRLLESGMTGTNENPAGIPMTTTRQQLLEMILEPDSAFDQPVSDIAPLQLRAAQELFEM